MTTCRACGESKLDAEFALRNKATGKRHTLCRACKKDYNTTWYQANRDAHLVAVARARVTLRERNRAWLVALKGHLRCIKCGEDHPACLDFHHKDPLQKDRSLADAISHGWSIARLEAEVAKCLVLCSNCHRKIHYEARSATG